MLIRLLSLLCLVILPTTWAIAAEKESAMTTMNQVAESYVKLCLQMSLHDGDFVDAYHGPAEWRDNAPKRDMDAIRTDADGLIKKLADMDTKALDHMNDLRHNYLNKQLIAMICRIDILSGKKIPFDEETKRLYDAVSPHYTEDHYKALVKRLDKLLPPGEGSLAERLDAFKKDFVIPPDKLDQVFMAAIKEARQRTRKFIDLPDNESFVVEYVTDKAWSGYNWYKGDFHSLIQVNTDLPIFIDRAVDLAAHEGYPGHHVYNTLLEKNMLVDKGWVEFSIYPLFSPQSLIAEGTANFGIEVAFPAEVRVNFEKEVLFPLAGLDPATAETYYQVAEITEGLSYAGNDAARGYLDGALTRDQAVQWLVDYNLQSRDRATQRLRFIDKYRGYVINYNLGQDMVKDHVNQNGGDAKHPKKRWEVFKKLISAPYLPAHLKN